MNLDKYFNNKDLLELALTHRSYVNEHKGKRTNNERLEFLGDAVLEFIVSEKLYLQFQDKEEGFLTALRSNLVNTQALSQVAKKIGLGNAVNLSKGEEETGGRDNPSILADTLEAIIGAIYLDQGIAKATDFVETHILNNLKEVASKPLKDAKSRLQELVQSKGYSTPRYVVVEETGPDHFKEFTVQVLVNNHPGKIGKGRSKAEAEQDAATNALSSELVNKDNN